MGDAVFGAAREVFAFAISALANPNAWLPVGLVFAAAATAVFVRGKFAWSLCLPILAAAAYLIWRRFRPY